MKRQTLKLSKKDLKFLCWLFGLNEPKPLTKQEIREINYKNGCGEFFKIGGPHDYAYGM